MTQAKLTLIINVINALSEQSIRPRQYTIHKVVYFLKELLELDIPYDFFYITDKGGMYSRQLGSHLYGLSAYNLLKCIDDNTGYTPYYETQQDYEYRQDLYDGVKFVVDRFIKTYSVSFQTFATMLFLIKKHDNQKLFYQRFHEMTSLSWEHFVRIYQIVTDSMKDGVEIQFLDT